MEKGVDYIGVSVCYFCHDGKGKFIMGKRSDNARDEHSKWDIGAGGVEITDSIEETLKKEIKEEYCTEVLSFEFLGFRDIFRNHFGTKTHWLALDYKVLVDPTMVNNGEPHKMDEVKWFNLSDLPSEAEMHSQWSIFLNKYRERLQN